MRGRWLFRLLPLILSSAAAVSAQEYDWQLPDWAPRPVVPADNVMTAAKVELGRHLFYDTRLSLDQTVSCATCHQQEKSFTDGRAVPLGIGDAPGFRSSMSLLNVAYLPALTWANPVLKTLEAQALVPIFGNHPAEMGMEGQEALLFERLRDDQDYRTLFMAAFPEQQGEVSLFTLTRALAAFQRSLVSFEAPYYRYKYGGDVNALSESAKRGEELFFSEKLECYHCHGGLGFTDNVHHSRLAFAETGFHNTGLYNLDGAGAYPRLNPGLREITDNPEDEGRFRTPALLNIAVTAPYMHDGSIATLREVLLDHYAKQGRAVTAGQSANPRRSMFLVGFELSPQELDDMLAFLDSLTDTVFLNDPRHGDPFAGDDDQRAGSAVTTSVVQ